MAKVVVLLVAAVSFSGCDWDPLEYCMSNQDECPPRRVIPERYTPRSELLEDLERFRMKLEAARRAELERSEIDTVGTLDSPATSREQVSPYDSPDVRTRKLSDAIPMTRKQPLIRDLYHTPKLSGSFRPKKFDALEAMRLHCSRYVDEEVVEKAEEDPEENFEDVESEDGTDSGDDDNSLPFGEPEDMIGF
jgi:hypothetical protein